MKQAVLERYGPPEEVVRGVQDQRPAALFDTRRTTGEAAEVVELGPADSPVADHFDLIDSWGMDEERPLELTPLRLVHRDRVGEFE